MIAWSECFCLTKQRYLCLHRSPWYTAGRRYHAIRNLGPWDRSCRRKTYGWKSRSKFSAIWRWVLQHWLDSLQFLNLATVGFDVLRGLAFAFTISFPLYVLVNLPRLPLDDRSYEYTPIVSLTQRGCASIGSTMSWPTELTLGNLKWKPML